MKIKFEKNLILFKIKQSHIDSLIQGQTLELNFDSPLNIIFKLSSNDNSTGQFLINKKSDDTHHYNMTYHFIVPNSVLQQHRNTTQKEPIYCSPVSDQFSDQFCDQTVEGHPPLEAQLEIDIRKKP